MSYPVETDEFGNAIPPLKTVPKTHVPKKCQKYASVYTDRELYKVERHMKRGFIIPCFGCGREIPSLEEFTGLFYRVPRTAWTGKKVLALCNKCMP